ncbi:MAG: hypothetical protein AAFQ13_00670 [Pseudomonadota bacterium]
MIARRLTMRAAVERDTATGTDAWGGPVAPSFTALHDALPCFVWSRSSREMIDGQKTAMIEDLRIMVALGTDLAEGDEITAVSDATGTVIIPGRLKVEGAVQFKHNHLEAALQRIG